MGAKDDTLADAILAQKAAERSYQRALQSLQDWNAIWTKKFGWQEGPIQARRG
ncbi:hypothetical protein [Ensifer sp. ENS12]|uniref:hypothetical protein n=1 Tax=Ensifer sp. ENS12 TaxID=2854774 RepID=UPI001C4973B8|nr:hypothetical protein [Ensifer sp. ENS12]MBV7521312.1 hypothetical protein [Ensifer sp. ENS12]